MSRRITLYGAGYTRSARCLWTLLELEIDHEYVDTRSRTHDNEGRAMHPQAKLPVAMIDGEALYESAAICTHLCDLAPEKGLLGAPGTRNRGLHMQWTSFVLTEIETWLWSSYKHQKGYPEAMRVPAVIGVNGQEIRNGLAVVNDALAESDYLVGNTFSVTDIIVSWAINWARRMHHLNEMDNLSRYLDRLFARPHCRLNPE